MNDFEKKLQDIIDERLAVLFEIERVLYTKRYNLSQKHIEIFSIQSISIIYSIWEGFIQQAFQLYVSELNILKDNFNQFTDEIIIHHMENTFKQLSDYPKKSRKKTEFFMKLEQFYTTKNHDLSRTINTESNVNFQVLNKLLVTFSLEPFPEFWDKYCHPNPNLERTLFSFLRYRNSVAHGGDVSSEEKVTHEFFKKYKNLVVDLMYAISDKMNRGITDRTFEKDSNLINTQT